MKATLPHRAPIAMVVRHQPSESALSLDEGPARAISREIDSAVYRPAKLRTLSKSDYKLARGCIGKLFFRENGYPDNRGSNPYVALLAEGGYMVEALAKAKYS